VARYWALLAALRGSLRNEQNVRAAVVFGSIARGDANNQSDIDLLVVPEPEMDNAGLMALQERLERKLERQVDLHQLADIESQPQSLAAVLREGRPVIDREGWWPRLQRRAPKIERMARAEKEEHLAQIRSLNAGMGL
jgi:predicted nucleotidyltransferase